MGICSSHRGSRFGKDILVNLEKTETSPARFKGVIIITDKETSKSRRIETKKYDNKTLIALAVHRKLKELGN